MYTCCACDRFKCTTSTLLFQHLRLRHASMSSYRCTVTNCLRLFSTLKTFKKHFQINHPPVCDVNERGSTACPRTAPLFAAADVSEITDNDSDLQSLHLNDVYSPSCTELKQDISDAALSFAAKMYSCAAMTRSSVQDVVEGATELFCGQQMTFLAQKVLEVLKSNNAPFKDIVEISSYFEAMSKPFDGLETDYLRLEALKETEMYIPPEPYVIGSEYKTKKVNQAAELVHCNVHCQHVPMKKVLQKALQIPGALDATLDNLQKLNASEEPFSNFVQGSLWKRKINKFGSKIVLPLFVYYDDFEPDNALGSHATHHKLGAVYYSIACFPAECISKLENIFLGLLFLAENKVFKYERVLKPILDDLIDLEENGLKVNGKHVYFVLASILGDNLGMHELLGFVKGFRANHPCRICRVHRDVLVTQVRADPRLLRTPENYQADLEVNDVTQTGIHEKCIFNKLASYGSPPENPHCDLMHDIAEGVAKYDMGHIVHYIIRTKNYMSLFGLNERVRNFDYHGAESGNVLPPITEEHLKKKKIKFSACEMLTFIRYFSVMVGDYIPEDDEVWLFYLKLREIVHIVTAPCVDKSYSNYLRVLISEHHEMFITLFKCTLKPKMHFMLHYPELMLLLGPLVNIWSTRWESKHRPSKQGAHIVNSRVNLPFTLAVRHQLAQSYRFLSGKPFLTQPFCGASALNGVPLQEVEDFHHFSRFLPVTLLQERVSTAKWANVKGTRYEPNMALATGYNNDGLLTFGVLTYIVPCGAQIYFILSMLKTTVFDDHYFSYKVAKTQKWKCRLPENLLSHQPHKVITAPRTGQLLIPPRFLI